MVEAVSCNRPSAFKGVLATSMLAGVLNAGVQAGYELYGLKAIPKMYKNQADIYLKDAISAEKVGKKELSNILLQQAEQLEQCAKNHKFRWKNVGRGALWGAALTAGLCLALRGVGAIFGRR